MPFLFQQNIPSREAIRRALPLSSVLEQQVAQDRIEIQNILSGKDSRKLIIVGPCSAWPFESVLDYARKLKPLADELSAQFKIVMRVYIQKPRTGLGWTGPLSQPNPFANSNIEEGIGQCRKMMLEILKIGLPIADEMVFPRKESYFRDIVSWLAVGARSTQNPEHRIIASGLDIPVGLKNATSGEIETGIHSVEVAQHSHVFALENKQWKTSGNEFAHLVLRGGVNGTNYDEASLIKAASLLHQKNIQNPAIIIDVSHGNSTNGNTQTQVLKNVSNTFEKNSLVKGVMIESFLKSGNQTPQTLQDVQTGVSMTDDCLGWEETEKILKEFKSGLEPDLPLFSDLS
jgi:3-deoxy-7-phosphoheptulonate synthase